MQDLMEKLVSLSKRRGFIFPGSDIYGGLANSWDYGPLGVELKNNIKQAWWKRFVHQRSDMVGIDAALIMNTKVWEASGHLKNFSDPLVECKKCHNRFRADHLNIDKEKLDEIRVKINQIIEKWFSDIKIDISSIEDNRTSFDLVFGKVKAIHDKAAANVLFEILDDILRENDEKIKNARTKSVQAQILIDALEQSYRYLGFITKLYLDGYLNCPNCEAKEWEEPKSFNLMFKTFIGPAEDSANIAYFRPETAQAMFVDFKQVVETTRKRLPFGIAQIGKAFRNEITPGNFIFRMREFEQMEIEYFIEGDMWEKEFNYWLDQMYKWMVQLGLSSNHIHKLEVTKEDLAHYSKRTVDIEYDFPFGRGELYGLAYRTDFDLSNHERASGRDLKYTDPVTQKKIIPHVIEPTFGVDRSVLAVLCEAYTEETVPTAENGETDIRVVLKLPPALAPFKAAVLPLSKKEEMTSIAEPLAAELRKSFAVDYDETQSIGKRYRRQDEIGTPFCITVDFETPDDKRVTVRERDTMKQERVAIAELTDYLKSKL